MFAAGSIAAFIVDDQKNKFRFWIGCFMITVKEFFLFCFNVKFFIAPPFYS